MELTNRLENGDHRMSGDLHRLVELMPGYVSVALSLDYRDTEEFEIAATDGRTVFAGPQYPTLAAAERRFVLAHEFLHVVLGHIPRTKLLARREGPAFDRDLANLTQDALINTSLVASHRRKMNDWEILKVPEGAVRLGQLLKAIGDLPEKAEIDDDLKLCGGYSFEDLYYRVKAKGVTLRDRFFPRGDVLDPGAVGQADSTGVQVTEKELRDQILEARDWLPRLRGHLKGTVTRLAKEFPKVEVPWEEVLASWLVSFASGKRKPDFGRPSRRFTALEGEFSAQGVNLPFEPARGLRRTGRIAIAVDTSGSISDQILESFLGHMAAIVEQWKPRVLIVVADAEVQEEYEFEGSRAVDQLREIVFTGGGGTDFRPAIRRAGEWRPDVLVYLTDLCGECGEAPNFPVVWAVHPGCEKFHEWGNLVVLK